MDKLAFLIQGSKPYRVVFEGAGVSLAAFCTCPAGKRSGKFCKHVAWLLKGDASKLIEGIEVLPLLLERAQGSPLLQKAQEHKATVRLAQIDLGPIQSLQDLAEHTGKRLAGTDKWHEYAQGDNGSESLRVFMRKHYKNGKPYKNPTLLASIAYEPFYAESAWGYELQNAARGQWKVNPWKVDSISCRHFSSAASRFLERLEKILMEI